jgi:lipopolysaccharide/colanic/teichoic acid biosynthesis glycosyltransferase
MTVGAPRPETLVFADCFSDGCQRILDYTAGLFAPTQAMFRNESSLYPADQDPRAFYRTVLFPAKARIDLCYFSQRSIMSDIGWIVRSLLAVVGFSTLRVGGLKGIEATEKRLLRDWRLRPAAIIDEGG